MVKYHSTVISGSSRSSFYDHLIDRISSLANVDKRLLDALRVMHSKEWVYGHSSTHSHLLTSYAKDRGYPSSWGDPQGLPACGGANADVIWKALGVPGRRGVGGLPCELLHSRVTTRWGLDNSCLTNVGVRFCLAFIEAVALYLPVSVWPAVHCAALLITFEGPLLSSPFYSP
jgi:hypothetical protein